MKNKSISGTKGPGKGGARPGAGRPKGKQDKATLEKQKVQKELHRRIMKSTDRLFNAQISLAEGCNFLMRIDKDSKGNNKPAVVVESEAEIKDYLDENYDSDSYYYITTQKPDNKAIDSMIDRVYGKATNNVDIKSDGEKIIPILGNVQTDNSDKSGDSTEKEN